MGPPLSERPPLPAEAERLAAIEAKKAAKDERKAANGRWINAQRMAQRKREQEMAEKAAVREATNQWLEERKELVKKAKVLEEAKMESRVRLQKAQTVNEQRRLANIAKMEVLRKEKLARLEKHLDNLEKTLQDPDTPDKLKGRLEERKPWLLIALERCRANAVSEIQAKTSTEPAAPPSARKPTAVSLKALSGRIQERIGLTEAEILELEKKLLQPSEHDSLPAADAAQTAESVQRAIARKTELMKSLEQRESRIRTYLQTVKGKEQEYASQALKWQILVDELRMVSEEKSLAVKALATLRDVSFGSHIRKWSPERIAADDAKRRAKWEAQMMSTEGVLPGVTTAKGDSAAPGQNKAIKEAVTKEESKEGKQGAPGGWFKW
jgi:hypothetical protein